MPPCASSRTCVYPEGPAALASVTTRGTVSCEVMASGAAAAAPEAYAQGSRGDFRRALGLLAALDGERTRAADAWAVALRAQLWLADPGRGALPEAGTLASFRD